MIAQTLCSWHEFDELSSEWNNLLEKSSSPSVFLTWEWIQAWRRVSGDSASPFVIVVRDENGKLCAIAPLYRATFVMLGVIRYRALRFMSDIATGSDYPDWIVDKEHEPAAAEAISAELAAHADDWDLVWLSAVAGWTNTKQRIIEPAEKVGLPVQFRTRPFSALELPSDPLEYENSFSSRRRQQMRRNFRRTDKIDGVTFVHCTEASQVTDFLDALFDLHQKRWHAIGLDGCFVRRPAEAEFYREFATAAFENGWMSAYGVIEHGIFRAVQFGYTYNGSYLQLQEGYDPEFQQGAGNALRLYGIRDLIAQGVTEYDFLAGDTEHKRRWSSKVRDGFDILIGSGSLRSRLMITAGIWPTGRWVKPAKESQDGQTSGGGD